VGFHGFLKGLGRVLMVLGRVCCEILAGGRERQIQDSSFDPPPHSPYSNILIMTQQ
jgi:hypothetical protein